MKKRLITVAGVFLALIAIGVSTFLYLRGPVYEGHTINYWLEKFDYSASSEERVGAEKAFQAMGSGAVRHVFIYVEGGENPLDRYYRKFWERLPETLSDHLPEPTKELRQMELFEKERGRNDQAKKALQSIGPDAIPKLLSATKMDSPEIRIVAIQVLSTFYRSGREIPRYLPTLIQVAEDTDASVRQSAAMALGEMGSKAEPAVPALIRLLESDQSGRRVNINHSVNVRGLAANALVEIGILSDEIAEGLTKLSESFEIVTATNSTRSGANMDRHAAVMGTVALWRLTGDAEYPLQRLIKMWPETDSPEKHLMVESFGEMKIAATDAIPVLSELLEDNTNLRDYYRPTLLSAVTNALQKIDPDYFSRMEEPASE